MFLSIMNRKREVFRCSRGLPLLWRGVSVLREWEGDLVDWKDQTQHTETKQKERKEGGAHRPRTHEQSFCFF